MDVVKLTELIIRGVVDLSYVFLASYVATLTSRWLIHRLDVLGAAAVVFQRREPMDPNEEEATLSEPIQGTVDATAVAGGLAEVADRSWTRRFRSSAL